MPSLAFSRTHGLRICALLVMSVFLLAASDDSSRMDRLGHRMMCMCSCSQILMECNHVGCTYSETMRQELTSQNKGGPVNQFFNRPIVIVPLRICRPPNHNNAIVHSPDPALVAKALRAISI